MSKSRLRNLDNQPTFHGSVAAAAAQSIPTGPFTTLEPQDQVIGEATVVQKRRETDFEALKLWKGRSGNRLSQLAVLVLRVYLNLFKKKKTGGEIEREEEEEEKEYAERGELLLLLSLFSFS